MSKCSALFASTETRVRCAATLWEVLGLAPPAAQGATLRAGCDDAAVRAAFFRDCRVLHPDKVCGVAERAVATFALTEIGRAHV